MRSSSSCRVGVGFFSFGAPMRLAATKNPTSQAKKKGGIQKVAQHYPGAALEKERRDKQDRRGKKKKQCDRDHTTTDRTRA